MTRNTPPLKITTKPVSGARPRARPRGAVADKIFISYRRDDARASALHLYDSLARRFGADKVFLDQSTIEPGASFPGLIRDSIAESGVVLVVIGPRWAGPDADARRSRLLDPGDWVRQEIELALRARLHVIPLLVEGATMPAAPTLPASLKPLVNLQAVSLPWHETIGALAKAIAKVTESSGRYDLTRHLGDRTPEQSKRAIVLTAMELSLAYQGERVLLDDADLATKFKKATKRALDEGVLMNEIMYVVDRVGIDGRTARGARRTYTARAFRLSSTAQIPGELAKGRPVIAGMMVSEAWFGDAATRSGLVEAWEAPGVTRGAIMSAIVGFEPADGRLRFLTPWPEWGEAGIGTLTDEALQRCVYEPRSMYSVEAAEAVALR